MIGGYGSRAFFLYKAESEIKQQHKANQGQNPEAPAITAAPEVGSLMEALKEREVLHTKILTKTNLDPNMGVSPYFRADNHTYYDSHVTSWELRRGVHHIQVESAIYMPVVGVLKKIGNGEEIIAIRIAYQYNPAQCLQKISGLRSQDYQIHQTSPDLTDMYGTYHGTYYVDFSPSAVAGVLSQ